VTLHLPLPVDSYLLSSQCGPPSATTRAWTQSRLGRSVNIQDRKNCRELCAAPGLLLVFLQQPIQAMHPVSAWVQLTHRYLYIKATLFVATAVFRLAVQLHPRPLVAFTTTPALAQHRLPQASDDEALQSFVSEQRP